MAPVELVPIAVRPRHAARLIIAAMVVAAAAGCSHRRESMRPIFTSPASVAPAAPCTNCGSGGSARSGVVITPGASASGAGRVLSSDSDLPGPSGAVESTVPPLSEPTSTSKKSTLPEPAPKAEIGDVPDLRAYPTPSKTTRLKPPAGGTSSTSPSGKTPMLEGPAGASTDRKASGDGLRAASATVPVAGRIRRVSTSERLHPFLDETGENELYYPSKADRPWQYVVLHHSANHDGSLDSIDAEHRKVLGYDGCGYHFVIGNGTGSPDGRIEIAQRWARQKHGVHCRNARQSDIDEYGIGICLVGNLDKEPPTPRQVEAARALVGYLGDRYRIDASRIETHAEVAATQTVCPGRYFDMDAILGNGPSARAAEAPTPGPAAAGWRSSQSKSIRLN
ncbi:N-acetylmuramoyl-L-alanine amidase [Aquisphaera giovannonii]|uniref:N-acetylmuramoyl-L-alanine amidase n=1 Tax=Aquisphaera giovannonii TaxID=406548 RepID=A0A5B9WAI4_9BACT|nr:N-acetylmuramoyl-L-alanine amidase [Aquisphaera giovannonii]QEH37259.1 N-acetylmuramoyl-L-alanine amidase [Aquisphaera giovannonii]